MTGVGWRGRLANREALLGAVIVAIFLLVDFQSGNFLSTQNIRSILTDTTTVGIIAIGVGIVIICGGIDISVGSTLAAAATVSGALAQGGSSVTLAVLAGIAAGCALGGINAILIVVLKIEPIVATLATLGIFRGVLSEATAGRLIGDLPAGFREIGSGTLFTVPYTVWVMFGVAILAGLVMKYTAFGRTIYAIGNNASAVRLSGIKVAWYQASTYVIAGGLAGLVACCTPPAMAPSSQPAVPGSSSSRSRPSSSAGWTSSGAAARSPASCSRRSCSRW